MLVPRPISSRITRLRGEAVLRIRAVSVISTMNVLCPRDSSSLAPTRAKIRSAMPISARVAGTKLPICARSVSSATWRMYVLLPAMFGPVISRITPPVRRPPYRWERTCPAVRGYPAPDGVRR